MPVFCGNDNLAQIFYSLNAKGIISVTSNVFPRAMLDFHENATKRSEITSKLYNFNNLMFIEPNPIPVKYALNLMGYDFGKPRLPLIELSDKNKENLKNIMKKHGLI